MSNNQTLFSIREKTGYTTRLLLSKAESAILRDDLDCARSYLLKWEVKSQKPSGLGLKFLRRADWIDTRGTSKTRGEF